MGFPNKAWLGESSADFGLGFQIMGQPQLQPLKMSFKWCSACFLVVSWWLFKSANNDVFLEKQ